MSCKLKLILPPPRQPSAISVIIPMYNREKYIGECLDSLLAQTFQDFEVIVIDDCSTDNSVAVVESYAPKFGGKRLKLIQMEKNTGHPGEPRNRGIAVAQGEYVYCLDSDDAITETAFEEMYTLGKEYDADVVYTEKYFRSEGFGQEFKDGICVTEDRIQKPPFVDKPTLETNDLGERVKKVLAWNYWMSPALKLVKRDLLIENEIKFPLLVGSEDDIWSMKIFFLAKRFLRVPNICFIRRIHEDGISFGEYSTPDHVQRWMDVAIRSLKDLDNFMGDIEYFRDRPGYRYDILARSVRNGFNNIFEKCETESAFNVYKIFQEKFGKYLGDNDVLVSSICSYVVSKQRELNNRYKELEQESQRQITRLETELKGVATKKPIGISVVIPMYNVADFIGELLDSLLYQTFEDFEVILVDDRSTDDSFEIAQSYVPKFNGRLTLLQLEKNSGGAGEPRNVGLTYTRGEYVIFFDADDFILLSGLETLYKAAKGYDADVVYTGAYYNMPNVNDVYFYRDGLGKKLIREGKKDEPTLIVDDQKKILDQLLCGEPEGHLSTPWPRLVRREVLINNHLTFPITPNCDDFIWVISVYSHAKRFLRIPTPFYFYRRHTASLSLTAREPSEQIAYWVSAFVTWAKALNALEDRTEILKNNPIYCYRALERHFKYTLIRTKEAQKDFTGQEIYELLHRALGKEDKYALVLSLFFSQMDAELKINEENASAIARLNNFLTSRIDIQLVPKAGTGDFQILNVSDDKAKITKPVWFQKNGVGYMMTSGAGKLQFVAKASVDGQIRLSLKGLDVRTKADNSKRITYWINYTRLTVNGKRIFDTLTPAWHDKTYNHNMNVKAGEEVTIQVEWANDSQEFAPPPVATNPAISVIIPMFNAEDYVGECLDSLLAQTFQDFEVIVADDCSTDSSPAIVESYMEKFDGRLKLTKTKKNSGTTGYVARNRGFTFARGEYVYFMDADDMITKTAFEELYNAAKKYDAEVVYSGVYNLLNYSDANNIRRDPDFQDAFERGLPLKPILTVEEPHKNIQWLLDSGTYFWAAWTKFVKRSFLTENKITFPEVLSGGDFIWAMELLCHAERFLRIPNAFYFYRRVLTSRTRKQLPVDEQIVTWNKAFVIWAKALKKLSDKIELLQDNPGYCYSAMTLWLQACLKCSEMARFKITSDNFYEILKDSFADKDDDSALMVPFIFSVIDSEKRRSDLLEKDFDRRFTARVDIQLLPKAGRGDLQILDVSDDKAEVLKPDWFQKNGIGYQIESSAGKLELIAKTEADGQIKIDLKGVYVLDPTGTLKCVPYWIDYTNLTINGKKIIGKRTPAWHDKPFRYTLDAKAGEEVKIQVEWLPHRDGVADVSAEVVQVQEHDTEQLRKSEALISELNTALSNEKKVADKQRSLVSELRDALSNEKKKHKADVALIGKFKDYFTARADIKLIPKEGTGDFQIVSVSDSAANVEKPKWFQKDGAGYVIQSHAGEIEFVAKATVDGQISLILRGRDVKDKADKSKRIPYWIDFTSLVVKGKTLFNTVTPIWYNKPYRYDINVKAGEEIKIQMKWLPHRSDS